jgi:hypothetical protein
VKIVIQPEFKFSVDNIRIPSSEATEFGRKFYRVLKRRED